MMSDAELACSIALLPYLPERDPYIHDVVGRDYRDNMVARVKKELDWRYAVRMGEPLNIPDCKHEHWQDLDGWVCCANCGRRSSV